MSTKDLGRKTCTLTLAFASLLILVCANPSDTFRWRWSTCIPITNKSFILGRELGNLFKLGDTLKILGVSDTNALGVDSFPDVVAFAVTKKDSINMSQKHDALEVKHFHTNLGVIPISGTGTTNIMIPMGPSSIAVDFPFSKNDTMRYSKIRSIFFDTSSKPLSITITNTTPVNIDNFTITILNLAPTSNPQNIGTLAANGGTKTVSYPVGGSGIDSGRVIYRVSGTLKATGNIAAGEGVSVQFTLDSLRMAGGEIMDSLLTFIDTFSNPYRITDTVKIDYADVADGAFLYQMTNNTNIDFAITLVHEHTWSTNECVNRHVQTLSDLAVFHSKHDSDYFYRGNLTPNPVLIKGNTTEKILQIPFGTNRLFPQWMDTISVTRVDYIAQSPEPSGKWKKFGAGDSLHFTITPIAMRFDKMLGTVMAAYQKDSDPSTKEIPFPWKQSSKLSLRGHFFLNRVLTRVTVNTGLPDDAMISKFVIDFKVIDPAFPAKPATKTIVLDSLIKGKIFHDSVDITDIVNQFPDSVTITMHGTVPVGTRMVIVNNMQKVGDTTEQGGMILHGDVKYDLVAPLGWQITGPVTMDLATDTVPLKDIKQVTKLMDKIVQVQMKFNNYTNVNGTLFCLIAPKNKIAGFDNLSTTRVFDLINGNAEVNGYVNLLGKYGVTLPPRNRDTSENVTLNEQQINMLVNSDTSAWRWELNFYPTPKDSLWDTDSIKIRSRLYIEGTNSMDSLFSN